MKALNNLKNIISTVEGYKQQFVENGLPNILIVDPVMSRFDFYSLILPSILLTQQAKANVAFTGITKFTDSPDKKPIALTDYEVNWANVIVFPFSIDNYEFEGVHLFDSIREQNPSIKIIFVCEVLFTHSKLRKSVIADYNKLHVTKLPKEDEAKLNVYIQSGIQEKINKADRILVPNETIKKEVQKVNSEKSIELIQPLNYNEIIREGLNPREIPPHQIMEFLNPKEIRILIHCLNIGKASDFFVKNVIEKAPDNVVFYSQTKLTGVNFLQKASITHWYKILFTHSFDFTMFVGDFNKYDINSQYLDGIIVDSLFMRSVPVVTNKNFNSVLSVQDFETVPENEVLKFIEDATIDKRVKLQTEYSKKIEAHEVGVDSVYYFERLFLWSLTNPKIKQRTDDWEGENAQLGYDLGYPDCCIKEFVNQPPESMKGAPSKVDETRYKSACINGKFTGFIPCEKHAKMIESGEIKLSDLITDRIIVPSFPNA